MNEESILQRTVPITRMREGCGLYMIHEEQIYEAMENIIKQGYLRKAFPSDRTFTGILDKIDPNKWFVLLVRNGKPLLEYYDKQNDVFSAEPVNSFDLSSCQQVTYTFLRNARIHTFNIVLDDRVIELASTARDVMISWCDCIESTLQRLGIYKKEDHDHVYSFCPAVVNVSGTKNEEVRLDEEAAAAAAEVKSSAEEEIFGTFEDVEDIRQESKGKERQSLELERKISTVSIASEEENSDYSGDFVGGDFFMRNRRLDAKKAETAAGNSLVRSERDSMLLMLNLPKNSEDTNNNYEDLDDGYPLLNCRKEEEFGACAATRTSPLPKESSSHINGLSPSETPSKKEGLVVNLPDDSCSDTCAKTVSSNCSSNGANSPRNSSAGPNRPENLYSELPSANRESTLLAARPVVPVMQVKPQPKKRTHLPNSQIKESSKQTSKWEIFDETPIPPPISSIPPPLRSPRSPQQVTNGSPDIPPLPPRFDSLPAWGSVSMDETALKQNLERPLIRVPSPTITNMSQSLIVENGGLIPPLPPRRGSHRGQRSCSASDLPPPLPARKSQSFRIQRPITSPPNFTEINPETEPVPRRPDRQLSMRMRVERGQSAHTVISLKHNQIDILKGEMLLPAVAQTVSRKACHGLALVDVERKVWIGGWNWKDYPSLHGKFHVGDQVISINSVAVETAQSGMKMLKHATGETEVVVKRIPFAKVFEIRREAEGQSLGIKREGGTGEILYVDPNGLAAVNGLPLRAESVQTVGFVCNWYFTEINSRHVSLFFKNLEIEHRLNAVGLELSYVVQPSDFISEVKKQLQKKIKNYKNYLPH